MEGDCLKPIVISGPSGVGKGTLISRLMKEFPSTFGFSVSHTTRSPREKEKDGVHYHFTQKNRMEQDISDGKFLEHASVHGNLYGTSIKAVEAVMDEGKVMPIKAVVGIYSVNKLSDSSQFCSSCRDASLTSMFRGRNRSGPALSRPYLYLSARRPLRSLRSAFVQGSQDLGPLNSAKNCDQILSGLS